MASRGVNPGRTGRGETIQCGSSVPECTIAIQRVIDTGLFLSVIAEAYSAVIVYGSRKTMFEAGFKCGTPVTWHCDQSILCRVSDSNIVLRPPSCS